jgi:hypothetical protein
MEQENNKADAKQGSEATPQQKSDQPNMQVDGPDRVIPDDKQEPEDPATNVTKSDTDQREK